MARGGLQMKLLFDKFVRVDRGQETHRNRSKN